MTSNKPVEENIEEVMLYYFLITINKNIVCE